MDIALGVLFFIIGIAVVVSSVMKKSKCTGVTTGVVVDVSREVSTETDSRPSQDSSGRTRYRYTTKRNVELFPIIEYVVGENKYVTKSESSSNTAIIGKKVEVHYNPQNPNQCYTGNNITAIVLGVLTAILGVIIFIFPFTSK